MSVVYFPTRYSLFSTYRSKISSLLFMCCVAPDSRQWCKAQRRC